MTIEGKKIFITGGAGFIGSHLVENLSKNNHVTIYDNLSRNALNILDNPNHLNYRFIQGDILDAPLLTRCIKDSEIVIHLAAIAGVQNVVNNPIKTIQTNVIGTLNILEACYRNTNLEKFIDLSTSEVFGQYANDVHEESSKVQGSIKEPRWTYASSKLTGEFLTQSYHREFGIPTICIRPFNIYGPRQVGEGAIHHFIKRALNNQDIIINNNGSQIRSWCYIDDFVNGILLVLKSTTPKGEDFNIGNPKATITVLDLAKLIIRLTNSNSKIVFNAIDYAEIENRIPNIGKARQLLNYVPHINLELGLQKTIKWYKKSKTEALDETKLKALCV